MTRGYIPSEGELDQYDPTVVSGMRVLNETGLNFYEPVVTNTRLQIGTATEGGFDPAAHQAALRAAEKNE